MLNVHFCCQSFRNEDILLPFRFCTIHTQRNKEKTLSSGRQEINGEAFKVAVHTAVLYIIEPPQERRSHPPPGRFVARLLWEESVVPSVGFTKSI